jgi:hypothetical protein
VPSEAITLPLGDATTLVERVLRLGVEWATQLVKIPHGLHPFLKGNSAQCFPKADSSQFPAIFKTFAVVKTSYWTMPHFWALIYSMEQVGQQQHHQGHMGRNEQSSSHPGPQQQPAIAWQISKAVCVL